MLPVLATNTTTPSVLLIGNNATGPAEITAALGNERPLLGFYGAGGTIREGVVYYGDGVGKRKGRLTFGELCGQSTPRLEAICAVFQSAGIPVVSCANMNA